MLVRVIKNIIRHLKVIIIQILKIVPGQKRLFGKLALACEDEIINTTEASFDDKSNMNKIT